jgi:hypothetical protein
MSACFQQLFDYSDIKKEQTVAVCSFYQRLNNSLINTQAVLAIY